MGAACLKFNVGDCGDMVNTFKQKNPKRRHLQIVWIQMIIRVCAILRVKHTFCNSGQY